MSNRFFNPYLAMGLRVTDFEKEILQISGESQWPAVKDVLEALKWIDTECDIAGKRIEELQGKRTNWKGERSNFYQILLSMRF